MCLSQLRYYNCWVLGRQLYTSHYCHLWGLGMLLYAYSSIFTIPLGSRQVVCFFKQDCSHHWGLDILACTSHTRPARETYVQFLLRLSWFQIGGILFLRRMIYGVKYPKPFLRIIDICFYERFPSHSCKKLDWHEIHYAHTRSGHSYFCVRLMG